MMSNGALTEHTRGSSASHKDTKVLCDPLSFFPFLCLRARFHLAERSIDFRRRLPDSESPRNSQGRHVAARPMMAPVDGRPDSSG